MSIMQTLFGAKPNTAPTTPGNIPAAPTVLTTPGNPTAPVIPDPKAATGDKPEPQGLDKFSDLFIIDPNATPKKDEPLFNIDPVKLAAAAKNNDFTKAVTPELLAAIAAGGEGAVKATMDAMNAMAQKGFGDSAMATSKMIEAALAKQQEKFLEQLPAIMKTQTLSENLRTANPIFNHPATAPILKMFQEQVAIKHPHATVAEQQALAIEFVTSFADAANPQKPDTASSGKGGKPAESDWSSFF